MNCIKVLTKTGMLVVLLFVTGCSEFPETKFTRGAIIQANVPPAIPGQTQPVIIKSQSSLPSMKLHSSFLIMEVGESRIVITDKDTRTHILSRALLYNDRFVSDVEAQVYEALRLTEGTESETDSLVQMPLVAMD